MSLVLYIPSPSHLMMIMNESLVYVKVKWPLSSATQDPQTPEATHPAPTPAPPPVTEDTSTATTNNNSTCTSSPAPVSQAPQLNVDRTESRLVAIEGSMARIVDKVDQVAQHVSVESRLGAIEGQIARVEAKLDLLLAAVTQTKPLVSEP